MDEDLRDAGVFAADGAGGVGADEDVGKGPEGAVGREGFGVGDVEGGEGDVAGLEGGGESGVVDGLAAADVDEQGAGFEGGEGGGTEHVLGFWGVGGGHDEDVGHGQGDVEFGGGDDGVE